MLLSNVRRVPAIMVSSTLMRSPQVSRFLKIQSEGGSSMFRGFKMSANNNKWQIIKRAKKESARKDRFRVREEDMVIYLAAFGIGSLASYYGLGCYEYFRKLSAQPGALADPLIMWTRSVIERIHSGLPYFGGSCVLAALSTAVALGSPLTLEVIMKTMWLAVFTSSFNELVIRDILYQRGFEADQLDWLNESGLMGAAVAALFIYPFCGPAFKRVTMITAVAAGGILAIAVCAPSEKFLNLGEPLATGFGACLGLSQANRRFPRRKTQVIIRSDRFTVYYGIAFTDSCVTADCMNHKYMKHAEALPPNEVCDPDKQQIGLNRATRIQRRGA